MSAIVTNLESEHLTVQETAPPNRQPIVVIGNGPVGFCFLENFVRARQESAASRLELIEDQPVIVFGEEPAPAYDRVHLTGYFDGKTADDLRFESRSWYARHGIELCTGDPVVSIDRQNKSVRSASGREVQYDSLIIATGSRPFLPPIKGIDLPGTFVYRTIDDVEQIRQQAKKSQRAAVLGGGLLGLEAARAFVSLGLDTHVIERAPALMPRQLDNEAALLLRENVEELGVRTILNRQTDTITSQPDGFRIEFRDGLSLNVDIVVIAAGIRPRDELARDCGLETGPQGGIVVDDQLQTSDEHIYAIGECACHQGTVYGLVAPGYQMAETLARHLAGEDAGFGGSDESTRLKLLGVDVALCGDYLDPSGAQKLVYRGTDSYRKLIIRGQRIVGAVGVGPFPELPVIQDWIATGRRIWPWHKRRFNTDGTLQEPTESDDIQEWPEGAVICSCRSVTRGALTAACADGCTSVEALSQATGAGTVCGTCLPMLAALNNQPAMPVPATPGRRWLLGASIAVAVLIPLLLIIGPVGVSTSVLDSFYQLDLFWQDSFWKQVSGFTLLGITWLALLLSLRKRIARFNFLNFGIWRAAHGVLGLTTIAGLIAHTGFRFGANLNLCLMICFLTLNFAGGLTGLFASLESRSSGSTQRFLKRWRPRLTLLHILFFWPFPVLVAFHIAAAYYL